MQAVWSYVSFESHSAFPAELLMKDLVAVFTQYCFFGLSHSQTSFYAVCARSLILHL